MKYIKLFEQFKSINEGHFDSFSKEQIDVVIYDDDLNSAMRTAQGFIGQDAGDTCGIYWSDLDDAENEWEVCSPDERLYHLQKYLELEDRDVLTENYESNQSEVREITKEVDVKVLKSIEDERNDVQVGDVVIATYFMGGFFTYEFEVKLNDVNKHGSGTDLEKLGNADDQSYYDLENAYHVIKKSTYDNTVGEAEVHNCHICGDEMIEGWVVDFNSYCSEECRRKDYTDEEYQDKYDSDDTDEAYWTQWY